MIAALICAINARTCETFLINVEKAVNTCVEYQIVDFSFQARYVNFYFLDLTM